MLHKKKYDGYQVGLPSMVYKFFDTKTLGCDVISDIMPNQELEEDLNKSINRKFEKQKVHSSFKDNIWGIDLADMQLIIGIYSKYSWVVPLKD